MITGKRWVKPYRQKTDHKSMLGGISARSFQACRRAVPISCHEQKAQTQGWPSLTLVLVERDNRSEKLDGRSGKVGSEASPNLNEWSVTSLT
jgi:hypothetical protein